MKAITIRGVEPDVAKKLKIAASEQNKSINQLVIEFIKKSLGLEKEKKYSREYNDLDNLFGSWGDKEYTVIQDKINQERQIDQEIWQ
jgi:plasmid stability protein